MDENNHISEDEIVDGKKLVKRMQRSRQVRKGRKRQNAFRTFLCLVMNVLIILSLVYLTQMPQWYLDENIFSVSDSGALEILNNKIVSTKKILAALKTVEVPEVPVYMAKTDNLKEKLLQFPPVEEVYIRRYAFPARLQIILREREPFITISPDAKVQPVAFFTKDGKLIGREYLPLKPEFKTLLVLSYGNKGDDYSKWDLKKLQKLDRIARYIEVYSKEPVEYVDLRNPEDVYVKIKSVNIRLGRLDEHVNERIERIPSILPEVQLMDTKIKYLDLRWKDTNYLKLDK
ncbi:cell division protein FtsQ/DivIB [bacterium]|uniref:Cell division protein FtsQ/DivIB n=1 Tax=Candidatus Scatenecus faecavium TaxID=2840915 RepID=A0A9D1FWL5_9BACT|nr:cell division protein FtsQ/DivIB [bacterium]HIS83382.1 cell division protein FtsQ/DivIB [Candidatus Scatenecus faecavium]